MAETLKEQLENSLATNNYWNVGCPAIPGKDYWECEQKFKVNKIIVLRKMVKDLEILEAEDNELATLVKSIIAREIAVANWQFKSGMFPIWMSIFSKAKGRAMKNLTGKSDLDNLSKGLLKNERHTGLARGSQRGTGDHSFDDSKQGGRRNSQ